MVVARRDDLKNLEFFQKQAKIMFTCSHVCFVAVHGTYISRMVQVSKNWPRTEGGKLVVLSTASQYYTYILHMYTHVHVCMYIHVHVCTMYAYAHSEDNRIIMYQHFMHIYIYIII